MELEYKGWTIILLLLGTWILDKANIINAATNEEKEMRYDSKWSNAVLIDHASQIQVEWLSIESSFYISGMYLLFILIN